MFGLMGLFGAACILWGAGIYLRLFLRRPRYDDPLAYAQALSLSRALDRRLEATSLRQVVWLKFYANMLLPFLGIAGGLLLGYVILSGAPPLPGAVVWMAAGGCALADLLFLRFYDRLSFCVNTAACLTLAAACFFAPPGGLFPRPPLWAAVARVRAVRLQPRLFLAAARPLLPRRRGAFRRWGQHVPRGGTRRSFPFRRPPRFPGGIPAPPRPAARPREARPGRMDGERARPRRADSSGGTGPGRICRGGGARALRHPRRPARLAARPRRAADFRRGSPAGRAAARPEAPPVSSERMGAAAPVRAASSPWGAWEAPAFAETASPSIWRPSGSGEAAFPVGMPPAGARPQFTRRAFVTGSFLHGRQARLAVCVPGQAVIIRHLPDARFSDYMQVSAVVEDGPPSTWGTSGRDPPRSSVPSCRPARPVTGRSCASSRTATGCSNARSHTNGSRASAGWRTPCFLRAALFKTVRCGAGASARCGARPPPTRRAPRPSRGPGGAPGWGARANRARRG